MTWTFVLQLVVLFMIGTLLATLIIAALRPPTLPLQGQMGPMGAPGPMGQPGRCMCNCCLDDYREGER